MGAQAPIHEETAVASIVERARPKAIHPFHAAMLAGSLSLFLGALLGDYAYSTSYQIEWSNFASWLLVGGMVFATIALLCAVIDLFRGSRAVVYTLVLVATWAVGFFDALYHARDAWAVMPTALVLSVIVAVLACVATWIGFSSLRAGGAR
jgi:uncharacterized membrane protein